MSTPQVPASPPGAPTPNLPNDRAAPAPRVWQSHDLMDGHAEVQIEHQGARYRLRVTALGRLILTK
jgi:hemin uptake protein HemP